MSNNKDTICILPWINFDKSTHYDPVAPAPCCYFEYKKTKPKNYAEYINNSEVAQARLTMLDGKKPAGCWRCYHAESHGEMSQRQSVNNSRFDQYQHLIAKNQFELKQIKLSVGNTCNLACRMCLPAWSNQVAKIYDKLSIKYSDTKVYDVEADNILRSNAKQIKYIDVLGGEPFYNTKFLKLLEWLVENDYTDKTIFITTNATIINKKILDLLVHFDKVVVSVSLDAIGPLYEYIRVGASWHTVDHNIKMLQQYFDVVITSTISVLNIFQLDHVDNYAKQNNLHQINKIIVTDPCDINPVNIPECMQKFVSSNYKPHCYKDSDDFVAYKFIKKLDQYHNTNITDVLPIWREYENQFRI